MTNEEAKVFLDNLKICINEHPVVADWLVEIANRKTENSSEKPNNCETCKHHDKYRYEYPCDECEGCDKWAQTEPTISKMEQVGTTED